VPYESTVGWRNLYSGKRDNVMLLMMAVSAATACGGLAMIFSADGASPIGVITLVIGLLFTVVFALLSFFSVFVSVSVLGVVLGVAALTTVLAVTTGFEQQFREKVLGVNAHVIIMKSSQDFKEYRDVMARAQAIDPDVIAVQPFIFAEMLVTRGKGELSGVAIKGVDPDRVTQVLDIEKHMMPGKGSVDSLKNDPGPDGLPPILMGKELAAKLKCDVGDDVTVVVPLSNLDLETMRAKSSAPRTKKFRVTGIFYSGFDEYDRRLMYTPLKEAQALLGHEDIVMGVELKIRDVDRADEIARKLGKELGEPPYQVQDWYELNHNLFDALRLQKIVLVVVLTLIIIVAAFNMVSALYMMVTDKTREIAILKSMGSTSLSVAIAFQVVGLAIGGLGTLLGIGLGLTACWAVGNYGYGLDPKVYLIDRLPISVSPIEVVIVALITMAVSVVATLFPAVKASALRPVDGLRYD
jgi:lipoprotein-releasing system permease protein